MLKPVFARSGTAAEAFREYDGTPVLYMFGSKKPFQFHSARWLSYVKNSNSGGKVLEFEGDHWFAVRSKTADAATAAIADFIAAAK